VSCIGRYDAANAVNPLTELPPACRRASARRCVLFTVGLLVAIASPATFAGVAGMADVVRVFEDSSALEAAPIAQVRGLNAERADSNRTAEPDASLLSADVPFNPSADSPGRLLLARAWPPLRGPPLVEVR
jgi:hypothetical protein